MALGTQKHPRMNTRRSRSQRAVIVFLWRNAWWLNAAVSLLLLAELFFLIHIPLWIFFLISAGTIALAITHTLGPRMVRSQFGQTIMHVLLKDLLDSFDQDIVDRAKLRCNVMQLDDDRLSILAAYPEKRDPMGSVTWTTQQGCCGRAVREQEVVIQNLDDYRGKPYGALLKPEDGLPLWGITQNQWEHTRDLGSNCQYPGILI